MIFMLVLNNYFISVKVCQVSHFKTSPKPTTVFAVAVQHTHVFLICPLLHLAGLLSTLLSYLTNQDNELIELVE